MAFWVTQVYHSPSSLKLLMYELIRKRIDFSQFDLIIRMLFLLVSIAARKLAYLYRLPTNEHKAKVGLSWLAKSTVSTVSFLQETISNTLIETADAILK